MSVLGSISRRALMASAAASVSALLLAGALPARAGGDSFTIAVIPDTQNYLDYTHQKAEGFPFDANEMFLQQMRYIADHLVSNGGDIAFVSSLGDVWQHQTLAIDPAHAARGLKSYPNPIFDKHLGPTPKVTTVEMPKAHEGFALIAGKTPFSVVPGNHDYDAMWTVKAPAEKMTADPSTWGMLHSGGLNNFRAVFGAETSFFKDQPWYVASHDGGADSAQIFSAGGYRFLHIGLQFDAPNASLAWAAEVIARYPGLPTIISTHDYMDGKASRLPNPVIDSHGADPDDNSPEMVWDKLISQHDQIFMVLCGHEHGQSRRIDDNRFGHKVWQILADYQDRGQTAVDAGVKNETPGFPLGIGDGWMRLMTFEMGGETPVLRVRTYSTHYKALSRETPQYAKWYREHEQPTLSDEAFHGEDDFSLPLTDFRTRFAKAKLAAQ